MTSRWKRIALRTVQASAQRQPNTRPLTASATSPAAQPWPTISSKHKHSSKSPPPGITPEEDK